MHQSNPRKVKEKVSRGKVYLYGHHHQQRRRRGSEEILHWSWRAEGSITLITLENRYMKERNHLQSWNLSRERNEEVYHRMAI